MRFSNYVFTKGSIVFVRFPSSSEKAFLNGRPLIVISNPSHLLRTLTVCMTGTQDKPGIKASFWNHVDKCYVGDVEESNIYPYSIMTIYTDQIVSSIGQLDPFIMKEVDKAIDFHLGRTDEIPGYLKSYDDHIRGVNYNEADSKYIRGESVSDKFTASYDYKREYHRQANSFKSPKPEKNGNTCITNDDIMAWTNEKPTEEIDLSKICRNYSELVKVMDEKSVNLIVSRVVPITLIAKKYSIITLTNISVRLGVALLNGECDNQDILEDYILIGMVLAKAFAPNSIKTDTDKYNELIDRISAKYKINTEDRRTWKGIESFYCT